MVLIAIGFLAGKRQWMRAESVRDVSNLIFLVLTPALLFRTMAQVHLQRLEWKPLLVYFLAVAVLFFGTLFWTGFHRRGAVLALAASFSNTVMIGISLVGLAYGEAGLVPLLTLVSLHSLVLLTTATVVLELAVAREHAAAQGLGRSARARLGTVWLAVRNAVIHPVPLPIVFGLVIAQTGWTIPPLVDQPLQWLGAAFGPLALLMVGVSVAHNPIRGQWAYSLRLSAIKNLLHPLLMLGLGKLFGLQGLPLTVMVVVASLPMGANVLLFAQRYGVAEELITASMAVSTVLALGTVALTMALMALV